jgi:hypothetical protein
MRYVAVSQTEGLICESDSEGHLVSDDSDIEDLDDLSEDADSSFLLDAGGKILKCSVLKPGLNPCAAPQLSSLT